MMKQENKRLLYILAGIGVLLLIPLIAMKFTNEINWTTLDFAAAAVLLLSTGLLCELVLRKVKQLKHRIVLCAVVLFVCFIVWVELAVGWFQ
jgi:Kef-type K+ transport system membrane component KefB